MKNFKNIIIGWLLAILVLIFYAVRLFVPVISDETTTMANAAWITGYDWSLMIAALGGYYYRFAQALMTVPFFAWLQEPDLIYRLTMVLQAVIQASIVPIVFVICRRHLKIVSEKFATLLGICVCLVPSMALYTFYYRGDYLLGVLPWYVLLTFLETMKAEEEGNCKKRIFLTVLTEIFCAVAYMSHTRGIVLIIAICLSALILQIVWKKKTFYWTIFALSFVLLMLIDSETGKVLKGALYSIGGTNANTLENVNMNYYFNIFSLSALKDMVLLCLSWLYTLIMTTQGLVLIGALISVVFLGRAFFSKKMIVSDAEKVVVLFSILVFFGYFAVGALFFKGTYLALRTGSMERRVDRLLYDRYAVCGAGMMVFVALYVICCRKEWFKWKEKLSTILICTGVLVIFFWKIFPLAIKYKGYIYNTITLNTFNPVDNPAEILSGAYYTKEGLIAATILGIGLMVAVILLSNIRKKWMPYGVLILVIVSEIALIHVNYVKIRKASNDYVAEATEDVVDFLETFETDVTDEYPYILKGGLSGIKIQFYQSQLMSYKMFGKKQEEQLDIDNYFIISDHDDIDLNWYEQDYYLFEDFDYENAEYDIVYVKGQQLMEYMESLGYEMKEYIPDNKNE